MSIPVINLTTSVLGFKQWESWEYQPFATETPTSWVSSALPAGMAINGATGLISGAATVAGVFVVSLNAINADGTSAPLLITIGIEPAAFSQHSGIDLFIDTLTGQVSVDGTTAPDGPLFTVKEGDDLMAVVRWRRKETVLHLNITSLQIAVKEFEPDATLVVSDEFGESGSGTGYFCTVHTKFNGTALAGALGNYEADGDTFFSALGEIEWVENNTGGVGPDAIRRTSGTFRFRIERDLGEVA